MHFFRMVKSEFRRILSDKIAVISFLLVFAAIIVLVSWFLATTPMFSGTGNTTAGLLEEYQKAYEYYLSWYLYYTGEGPAPGLDSFGVGGLQGAKEQMQFYKMLMDTQTTQYYYVDMRSVDYLNFMVPDNRGAFSMFYVMKNAFYPLLAFSLITAIINCVSPYAKGIIKNYYASPVGKRTVLGGKLAATSILNIFVWLIVVVWGLILGSLNEPVMVLWYTGESCVALSQYAVFVTVMAGTLVAMLFITCLTVFIGQLVNKPLVTAAIVVPFVFLFALNYFLAADGSGIISYSAAGYLPLAGLNGAFFSPSDYRLWVALLFHIAVGAGMAAFIIAWQDKNFFVSRRKTLDRVEG